MTQDEMIEMVRQAGNFSPTLEFLEAFAQLVAAKEREKCLNVCDNTFYSFEAADNIRARGEA